MTVSVFTGASAVCYTTGSCVGFHSPRPRSESHRFPLLSPHPPPGGERLLRVVIRVADIMKVIVITANVPRSQDTVALFASKARHSVPMGMGLIVLSLLT